MRSWTSFLIPPLKQFSTCPPLFISTSNPTGNALPTGKFGGLSHGTPNNAAETWIYNPASNWVVFSVPLKSMLLPTAVRPDIPNSSSPSSLISSHWPDQDPALKILTFLECPKFLTVLAPSLSSLPVECWSPGSFLQDRLKSNSQTTNDSQVFTASWVFSVPALKLYSLTANLIVCSMINSAGFLFNVLLLQGSAMTATTMSTLFTILYPTQRREHEIVVEWEDD